jgi:hypothetical protein
METNSTGGVEEVGVARSMEGKDRLLSDSVSSSPTCSTTTSVSCNYYVWIFFGLWRPRIVEVCLDFVLLVFV